MLAYKGVLHTPLSSRTGLNSEFSFSSSGYHTKASQVYPTILAMAGVGKKRWSYVIPESVSWK